MNLLFTKIICYNYFREKSIRSDNVQPHIYFWFRQVNHFKENNGRVKVLYEDTKIDKDKLWNKYQKKVENETKNLSSYLNPESDPSDLYDIYHDKISDAANIFWHAIAIHKYQYLMLLCQTWENELISFVVKEVSRYFEVEETLDYAKVMDKILLKNIDEKRIDGLAEIRELRLLVNVIKHGEGNSADRLRKKRPDYFKANITQPLTNFNDRMKTWSSPLLDSAALNIPDDAFYDYYEAINEFWDSMPERVYLDGKTSPKY